MQLTTVGYGKEYPDSSSGYSEYVYFEATVGEGEDADFVLSEIRKKVSSKLGLEDKSFDLERLVSLKERELGILEENISKAPNVGRKPSNFTRNSG